MVKKNKTVENGNTITESEENSSANSIINHLGGYHRCRLDDPVCLEFASDNLCLMLGYSKAELASLIGRSYTALMHPDDTPVFEELTCKLAEEEGCESVAYRLIKKDGTIIRVVETMASIRGNDGLMRGYSVVCEIPSDRMVPKSTTPGEKVAVMKVSGGSDPKIEQMLGMAKEFLSADDAEDDAEAPRFMDFVSVADREKIVEALRCAYRDGHSDMVQCTIVTAKGDGYKCDLWIERIYDGGCFEDSSFCVKEEIDFDYQRANKEVLSFSKVLFSSFAEDVFEVDRLENSVKYICHSDRASINALLNVRMDADDFLEWFLGYVSPKDRVAVRKFCNETKMLKQDWCRDDLAPSKIKFEMSAESSLGPSVALVMVPVSRAKYFLCLNSDFTTIGSGFCSTAVGDRKHIVARLFGSFSLSVDDEAVFIKSDKGRELLALMIEKRGAYLTTREAITSLWECEPDDTLRARYRKIASRLGAELKKNGIEYIVESERGARRIIPEFIECDYYDYRDGLIEPSGDFLPEYPWSEYVRID